MSSTKKRARSPEIGELLSTRRGTLVQTYQSAPRKTRWRGPKDDRIKALQKLERKRRSAVFSDTAYRPIITRDPQLSLSSSSSPSILSERIDQRSTMTTPFCDDCIKLVKHEGTPVGKEFGWHLQLGLEEPTTSEINH
jgi:hypothetical protein